MVQTLGSVQLLLRVLFNRLFLHCLTAGTLSALSWRNGNLLFYVMDKPESSHTLVIPTLVTYNRD